MTGENDYLNEQGKQAIIIDSGFLRLNLITIGPHGTEQVNRILDAILTEPVVEGQSAGPVWVKAASIVTIDPHWYTVNLGEKEVGSVVWCSENRSYTVREDPYKILEAIAYATALPHRPWSRKK